MADEAFKVLVAGAGVAGPAVAYWLSRIPSRRPLDITIVERSTSPRATGQAIDIRGPAVEVIQGMGLEPAVREHNTNERGLQRTTVDGRVIASFDSTGDSTKQGFSSEFEILRADFARLCCDTAARRPGVKFVYGDYISSLSQLGTDGKGRVRVEFTNGKLHPGEYDLVIGADGMVSRTRPHVTGHPAKDDLHDLGAYVAYFTMPRGGRDSATHSRWWNLPGGRSVLVRPSPAGTGAYLIAVRKDPALEAALRQDGAAQKAALAQAFSDVGPETARILAGLRDADDLYLQQIAQVHADRWHAGRIALVGDAGYCPSPFTGMGTSIALYGAYVLAGELTHALRAGGDGDVPAALARHERVLRPYVREVQKLMPGTPWIAHPRTSLGIWLLNFVFWFVNVSGLLNLIPASRGEDKRVPEYTWADAETSM
jgi:2-polyprenyl-6-methoxyphenol hydroxylase-like FAD-dependent oxidoreductase